jgi:UPF0716 protein FxsA
MFIKLLIMFTFVPILELYILIETGRLIGTGATILLILLTGVAGAWLARTQGLDIMRKIQSETSQGQMPADTLLDGMLVLIGGLLLLTPGLCTDLLGFSCLVPLTRTLWRRRLGLWLQNQLSKGTVTVRRF